jgi:hypothetical protein
VKNANFFFAGRCPAPRRAAALDPGFPPSFGPFTERLDAADPSASPRESRDTTRHRRCTTQRAARARFEARVVLELFEDEVTREESYSIPIIPFVSGLVSSLTL